MFDAHANINAQDQYLKTSLHLAAFNGNSEVVTRLIAAGAKLESLERLNETALCLAVRWKRLDVAKQLIAAGGSMEVKNVDQQMLLHWVVKENWIELVGTCIAAGVNMEARNKRFYTPLHVAALQGHEEIVKMLKLVCQDDSKASPKKPPGSHLLSVSCRVLHVHQHLPHPRTDGLHGEQSLLHHNVTNGLHTCPEGGDT